MSYSRIFVIVWWTGPSSSVEMNYLEVSGNKIWQLTIFPEVKSSRWVTWQGNFKFCEKHG